MNSLGLSTKENYLEAISMAANGAKLDFLKKYQSILKCKEVKKNSLPLYYFLRALLAIRAGEMNDAENCLTAIKSTNRAGKNQTNILKAIIYYWKGNMEESVNLLKECLEDKATSKTAASFISKINSIDKASAQQNFKLQEELSNLLPKNIRINANLFACKMLLDEPIGECINTFISSPSINNFNASKIAADALKWEKSNFSEAKENYSMNCAKAINAIEDEFGINIHQINTSDSEKNIINIQSILDERLRRVAIRINRDYWKKLPTKALQMLSKPYCWTQSQDQMLPFILSEITNVRESKSACTTKCHEIGPGTGYLMSMLTALENIQVTGSDCYDCNSFDKENRIELGKFTSDTAQQLLSYEQLDLYCYLQINNLLNQEKSISNTPIKRNKFCKSLLESAIVYSHLPSLDMYDSKGNREDAWSAFEWYEFFDNIFNHPASEVRSIIIAKNHHSRGLDDFSQNPNLETVAKNWETYFIHGNICCGLIVIARKKPNIKTSSGKL